RASFFLYRTEKKLSAPKGSEVERKNLLSKNGELKELLSEYSRTWDKNLKIQFIRSATDFHHLYLKFLE
ncbi:MAG TPA: hypothetical protein PKK94_06810, partial [Leptospiraceae bacterium]|nr:hypothetical protein [Leptospiraceae bacterium]